jgi:hypothetical protein
MKGGDQGRLVSLRAYARSRRERGLVGGTHRAVAKAIADGRISAIEGRIDPQVADIQWGRNTDPAQQARGASGGAPEQPVGIVGAGEAASTPGAEAVVQTSAQAAAPPPAPEDDLGRQLREDQQNRIRESALAEALRRQLLEFELATKKGELVRASDVRQVAFNKARVARDALLSLPDRVAGQLAAETDPAKVYSILSAEIRKICDELAKGEASPTRQ